MTTTLTQSAVGSDLTARWLPMRGRAGVGGFPLLCLPHAGGSASAFMPWIGRVPGVSVLPLQPPGREARYGEPAFSAMEPLVGELAGLVVDDVVADGRPYAVYGHSHGALIGFELAREIRRRGARTPVHLFVSGSIAPQCGAAETGPPVSGMPREEIVGWLRRLGGTPEWLLADRDALDMVLPAIKGDFTVRERYSYVDEPPLPLPITVIAGTADTRVRPDLQYRWGEQTAAAFEQRTLDGGHFAVYEQAALTQHYLREGLETWL